ncbi:hypothetical protein ACFL35_18580 [Candidatus Riflebacteria bacterium]
MKKSVVFHSTRRGSLLVGLLLAATIFVGGYLLFRNSSPPPQNPPVITQPSPGSSGSGWTSPGSGQLSEGEQELRTLYNEIQQVKRDYEKALKNGERFTAENLRLRHNELIARYNALKKKVRNPSSGSGNTSPPASTRKAFSGNRHQIQSDAKNTLKNLSDSQIRSKIEGESGSKIIRVDRAFSREELTTIYAVTKAVPPDFLRAATIARATNHARGGSISGVTKSKKVGSNYTSDITIFNASSFDFSNTLVHEMTHAWAFQTGFYAKWEAKFSPKDAPTSYGRSNSHEDLCESVAMYYTNPDFLRKNYPDRYEMIKSQVMKGRTFH